MPILYACIKIDPKTTIEYSSRSGTYGSEAHRVMQKIDPAQDKRASYSAGEFIFHVQVTARVVLLCVCDKEFKQYVAFSFLKKVKDAYATNNGPGALTQLQASLKREVELYNSGKGDKIQALQSEIDAVRGVMLENIDQLMDRGEKINILVAETEELNAQSDQFFTGSRKLKNAMWWKNVKLMLLIAFILIVVIFIITLVACGGFGFKKCKSDSPPPPPPPPPAPPASTAAGALRV
jgi:vesicle-associated membrane protein 7